MKALGGLILAAGLSSRMGSYKPLMEVDGQSMICHVISMMRTAGAEVIVVVTGYRREDLENHLADMNVEFAFNPDFATTQQLESLKIGLSQLQNRCERIMISPADVPLVHTRTVDQLLALDGDFIRPLYKGEPGHPVILKNNWISYVLQYDGPGGLKGAMESSGCALQNYDVKDMGVILDNDTRQDFDRLLRWHNRAEQSFE
ncbi:MAG: NTP transferase domain-containing protein [Brotaphodocola sp.]